MKLWRRDKKSEPFPDVCSRIVRILASWTPPDGVALAIEVHPGARAINFSMAACCCIIASGVRLDCDLLVMHKVLDLIASNLIAERDAKHAAEEARAGEASGDGSHDQPGR